MAETAVFMKPIEIRAATVETQPHTMHEVSRGHRIIVQPWAALKRARGGDACGAPATLSGPHSTLAKEVIRLLCIDDCSLVLVLAHAPRFASRC